MNTNEDKRSHKSIIIFLLSLLALIGVAVALIFAMGSTKPVTPTTHKTQTPKPVTVRYQDQWFKVLDKLTATPVPTYTCKWFDASGAPLTNLPFTYMYAPAVPSNELLFPSTAQTANYQACSLNLVVSFSAEGTTKTPNFDEATSQLHALGYTDSAEAGYNTAPHYNLFEKGQTAADAVREAVLFSNTLGQSTMTGRNIDETKLIVIAFTTNKAASNGSRNDITEEQYKLLLTQADPILKAADATK